MAELKQQEVQSKDSIVRLNEDVEFLRISCDKLARANRESTERLGSLEKLIRNSNGEANHKIGTLEKQLATMSDTVSRLEARFYSTQSKDTGVAITSDSLHQVPTSVLKPFQNADLLGYRRTSVLKNQDGLSKKNEMPVFSGFSPFDWICRAERFFSFGRYTDMEKLEFVSLGLEGSALYWFNGEMEKTPFSNWSQFTNRLLDRFSGSFDDEPVSEIFPVTALSRSSPKVLLKRVPTPEVVQEARSEGAKELIDTSLIYEKGSLKYETIPVIEHEEDISMILPYSHVQDSDELSLVDLQAEELHQHYSSPEVLQHKVLIPAMAEEEKFSKKMTSTQKNESKGQLLSGIVLDDLHTDFGSDGLCVHQGEELCRFQVVEEIALTLKSPCVQTKPSAYEVFDVWPLKTDMKSMKMEKEKLPKSWRFKYKFKATKRDEKPKLKTTSKKKKWSTLSRVTFTIRGTRVLKEDQLCTILFLSLARKRQRRKTVKCSNSWRFKSDDMMTETYSGQANEIQNITVTALAQDYVANPQPVFGQHEIPDYVNAVFLMEHEGSVLMLKQPPQLDSDSQEVTLLVHIKKHLLQIQVHQRQKQGKCSKTWMFKYKATRRHVQFLLSTSGVSRKSSSTWHRWRLKHYNTSALGMDAQLKLILPCLQSGADWRFTAWGQAVFEKGGIDRHRLTWHMHKKEQRSVSELC